MDVLVEANEYIHVFAMYGTRTTNGSSFLNLDQQ